VRSVKLLVYGRLLSSALEFPSDTKRIRMAQFSSGMLTRPTWHEAKAEAETRQSEAEAEAKEIFRGRGRGPVL